MALPACKVRAPRWINREYATGQRTRRTECDACGQCKGVIDGHSEDYSEPHGDHTGAAGLCYTCYMVIHCRFKAPAAWDRYRSAVRDGAIFGPFLTRNRGASAPGS
jgi:hypothetical protein